MGLCENKFIRTGDRSQIAAVSRDGDELCFMTRYRSAPLTVPHPTSTHRGSAAVLRAPPLLLPHDGDVFLTYISSMPLTLTLWFESVLFRSPLIKL